MKVLIMMGVSRREQWKNIIKNVRITTLIEDAAMRSLVGCFSTVQRMNYSGFPKMLLNAGVDDTRGRRSPGRSYTDSVESVLCVR